MPTSRKTAFDRRQVFIDNAERFTISTVAPDRVTSTAIHEAWHAVDHHKKLNGKWQQALKRNNVTLADKYKVSEYAASKDAELFAETGTAIELKIKIPANVKKAFEETIEGV
jgi:thymidylate kinase